MTALMIWLGDQRWVPDRLGSWLLRRFTPVEPEPHTDAEGRIGNREDSDLAWRRAAEDDEGGGQARV